MSNPNMSKQAINLSIDDGLEQITITNKFGHEIGVLYFRPSDTGIIDRYNEALPRVEKVVEPLHNMPDSGGDTVADATALSAALKEAREKLYEAFDYIFDANVSEAFFRKVNPFTITNGKFYFENVLEALGKYLSDRIGVEVKHLNERTAKYTHGYRTGAHKDGKK